MPKKLEKIIFAVLIITILIGMFLMLKAKGKGRWAPPPKNPLEAIVRFKSDGTPDAGYAADRLFRDYEATLAATTTLEATEVAEQVALKQNKPFTDANAARMTPSIQFDFTKLNIKPDSQVSLKVYGQALGKAMGPYGEISLEYLPVMMLTALQTQDRKDVDPLLIIRVSMIERIGDLLKTPTPESAKVLHLTLINSLLFLSELIYNMEKALTEPIVALESSKRYQIEYLRLLNLTRMFNSYFESKDVSFSPEEQIKFNVPTSTASTISQ